MTTVRCLEGSAVIVTGAAHGMGRAHVAMLAAHGAQVLAVDVDGAALAGQERDGQALAHRADLRDPAAPERAVAAALDAWGRIDVVVNNAGFAHAAPFQRDDDAVLDALLDVCVRAPVRLVRSAWPHLVQSSGSVVNVVSNAALFGKAEMTAYAAAKAALVGWTRSLSLEAEAHGVRVNAVAPVARTRLTEGALGNLAELLDPELVAALVTWLCRADSTAQGLVLSDAGGSLAEVVAARVPLGQHGRDPAQVGALLAVRRPPMSLVTPSSAADEMELVRAELGVPTTQGDDR